tara:strand:- start:331 stop:1632 length:1302 start_codon:yes stop_codon:yes gene_type:complete
VLTHFKKHIDQNFLKLKENKFLLAHSGGVDSSVLFDLFLKLDLQFGLVHCNFNLRGNESEDDFNFVKEIADSNKKIFFYKKFNTIKYSTLNKKSIQLSARELRYSWFLEILEKENYKYIVTAHHLNDQLETFLINSSRGSGLKGVIGIPSNNNNLLRPLLIFSKDKILDYAKKNKIKWREDSSNKENKYLRNFIRNKIIKDWIKYDPELINKFSNTLKNLNSTYEAFKVIVKKFKKDYFVENGNVYYISIKELTKLNPIDFYLFQLFEAYGYSNTTDLSNLINSQSGKYLLSKSHRLTKGREVLILSKIKNLSKDEFYWNLKKSFNIPIELKIVKNNNFDNKTISLNKNDLKLPLIVRKWKTGDFFYPNGMKGKKKISKYFKDEKFDINQKENQWLLCSGDNILWVIGKRADRRFLAKKQSPNIINIECQQKK